MDIAKVTELLIDEISAIKAIYIFGSHASGDAGPHSDLDLAVLADKSIAPLELWAVSSKLAEAVNREVDLLDFLAASRVMQSQILISGERIYCQSSLMGEVDAYQAFVLNDKLELDRLRGPQLSDIQQSGSVYD